MISDIALQEFQEIWKSEFGSNIPNDLAIVEATNLLTIFDAVYRPIKQSDLDEYKKSDTVK